MENNYFPEAKIPPHSIQSEQSVLGGLMLDNGKWDAIADKLSESHFYRKEHRLIFKTIEGLAKKSIPFDIITISEALDEIGELGNAGGLAYLGLMAKDTPSAANIVSYADIVRDRAILRNLIHVGVSISNAAYDPDGKSTADILQKAEADLLKVSGSGGVKKDDYSIHFELVEIAELIKNPVNISWTIRHLIEHNGVSLLYGKYGCGKSLVAFDMAYCVASGIDWHGKKTKQCPVVVLAGEGHSGIGDRFNALNIHYGNEFPRHLYLSKVAAKLSDSTNADWVMQAVEKVCPDAGLIVIDTLNRNFGVGDENSTKDMTLFISNVDNVFRNRGKTVIIVHHSGKNAEAGSRGSIVLPGSVEAELSVTGGDGALTISVEKQKNGKKLDNIPLRFKEIDLNRVDDEGEAIHSLVLLDELNAEFKHTFPGRPKTREATFWKAFDACAATDPITINGKIGVSKEIICNEFKIMAGLTGRSAYNAFLDVTKELINEGKLLQISGLYVKP